MSVGSMREADGDAVVPTLNGNDGEASRRRHSAPTLAEVRVSTAAAACDARVLLALAASTFCAAQAVEVTELQHCSRTGAGALGGDATPAAGLLQVTLDGDLTRATAE
ncbi:hypothetical protein LQW54_001139 [Pestalotiopsis sp. IQ-011]